jgi:sugar lactone lactonase YvrE
MRAWVWIALWLSGCGSRSGLLVPEPSEPAAPDAGTVPNPLCTGAAKDSIVTLQSGAMQPGSIGVSGETLVVAEWPFGGKVFRVPRTGGGVSVVSSDEPAVNQVVADAKGAYWVVQGLGDTDGALRGAASSATAASTQVGGLTRPQGAALFGDSVYFTDGIGPPNDAVNGRVLRLVRGAKQPSVLVSGMQDPWAIAVDASGVYFTDGDSLWSLPLAGGTPALLAGGFAFPEHLTTDGQHLYWSDAAGSVYRRDHSTGAIALLSGNAGIVEGIAADASGAYLVTRSAPSDMATGLVSAIHADGLQTLASTEWAPMGLAMDASAIYFVSIHGSSGRVRMLCRPQ